MKKFTVLLLAAICSLSVFWAGCGDKKNDEADAQAAATYELKSGFASIKELQSFEYSTYFYKASLNTDKEYVTEGESSARLYIKGKEFDVVEMKILSDTPYFGSKDFSKVNMVTLDVFNPGTEPRTFTMSFSTSSEGLKQVYQKYTEKEVTVQPGYNLVTYSVDRTVALAICDMKYAEYFSFSFLCDAEEYSLYFDNLRVHYTEEQASTGEKTFEDGEILLFNDYLDRFFVKTATYMCTSSVLPSFNIERDPRLITEGTGSLRVEAPQSEGDPGWDETPCLEITGEPIERYDFSTYSKIVLKWMPEYDGGRLSVRLRNADGDTVMFTPVCVDAAIKNGWQSLEIDLNDAENGFESQWIIETAPGQDPFVPGIDIENIVAIEIFYGHKPGNVFYLDDIRLVK